MPEWKDVLAAFFTLVASFSGAWAAFAFENGRRKREEDQKRIGAANRAIYTLFHYWNILEQYRKEALEAFRGKSDAWLNVAAHPVVPTPTDKFSPGDLQFLLEEGQPDAYVTLMLEEQRFHLAIGLIKERSYLVLNEVFPRMSHAGVAVKQTLTEDQVEKVLGVNLVHKLKEITAAIYTNVDEDLSSLKVAHNKLRSAMKELYPEKKFLQVLFGTMQNAPNN